MAQEVWDGILGGVSEQAPENVVQTTNEVSMQSLHIGDDTANNAFGMDFDPSKGIFDGMIFYTNGFSEKQVIQARNQSDDLERSPDKCDN
jgi:hypothetical protein